MTKFQIVKGDLKPSILATLQYDDGSAVNLTGCTVTFIMTQNGVTLINRAATIVNQAGGIVRYDWQAGDTNQTGVCLALFQVTYADTTSQTFPTSEDLEIDFPPAPPPPVAGYILVADVQAHLNMTYDSTSENYSVYGLTLGQAALQAQVDYANNYLNSILGSPINQSDPRYQTVWNVALDIACIRILVVSMGGSLVGAFDYFLGDLRVARAGPYKEAIQATLQGFREDLSRQLLNLTPAAVAFDIQSKGDVPTYRGGLASP